MRLVDVPWLRNFTAAEVAAFVMSQNPGIRLTLTQGTAITNADVTGATSIFAEPVNGGVVSVYKDVAGTIPRIMLLQPSTLSLALGTLASAVIPNDVFAYDAGAGSLGLEKLAWTNATTRATAIVASNGRWYKSADYSRLFVGTFYPTATTTTEDSGGGVTTQVGGKRFLWNTYNRKRRHLNVKDTADSWTYTTQTIRKANGATAALNAFEYVCGLADDPVNVRLMVVAQMIATSSTGRVGIGVNSTSAFSGPYPNIADQNVSTADQNVSAFYEGIPGLGYNIIHWLEYGYSGTAAFFLGDNTSTALSGMTGVIEA